MKYPEPIKKLNTKLSIIAGGMILIIGILSIIEVVARGIFHNPTSWVTDTNTYLLIWAIFLVSGYAFQAQGHVRVDLVTRLLPEPTRRVFGVTSYSICMVFIGIFTYSCWNMFYKSYTLGMLTYAFIQIPRWILALAMLIGCGIMFCTLISIIIDLIGKNKQYM